MAICAEYLERPDADAIIASHHLGVEIAGRTILGDICIEVRQGEVVALLGRNGSGKSTVLRTLVGAQIARRGRILLRGAAVNPTPALMLRHGVSLCLQGGRVFHKLSVDENLRVASGVTAGEPTSLQRIYEFLPRLRTCRYRMAASLSGGERQLLAVASAIAHGPQLLLLDEPLFGLSASVRMSILEFIRAWRDTRSVSTLIVEQNVEEVLKIADYVYVIREGVIVWAGSAGAFSASVM